MPGQAGHQDRYSQPLFGRQHERAALRESLGQALAGRGSLILVGGEAGIGKTALVRDLEREATTRGAIVLTGQCYELASCPPYGPWIEILNAYPGGDELPSLPSSLRDDTGLQAFQSQDRLFTEIHRFFDAVASRRPVVLILEDLHWSDRASLELLRFLSRRLGNSRLLLIMTYRSYELTRYDPLYQVLPALVRESPVSRINVLRLDREAIGDLVAASYELVSEDEWRLADYLYQLAEGNPFFIEELLRTLEESGFLYRSGDGWVLEDLRSVQVPPLVRQVIDGRLARLAEEERYLLEIAAVIGQEVPLDLWREVSGAGHDELVNTVGRAAEANILEELPGGRMRFSHALVRETLYASLVLPQRQWIHLRIAEVIAARPAPSPEAVAYHFQRVGDRRVIDWLIQAGKRAQAVYAPRAAIDHLTQAFELANQFSIDVPLNAISARALAHTTIGDFEPARRDYETAFALARAAGDQRAQWEVLVDIGMLWAERDYDRTGDSYRRALEIAREIDDPAILAHSLNRLGNWYTNNEQPRVALKYHAEALAMFERLDDRPGLAETLDLMGMSHYLAGDMWESSVCHERAIELFRELDDRRGLASSLATLMMTGGSYESDSVALPDVDSAVRIEQGELAATISREIGWRAGEAYALTHLGFSLASKGDYGRGLQLVSDGLSIAEEIEHRQWITAANVNIGAIYLDLLAFTRAREHLERARSLAAGLGSRLWHRTAAGMLASLVIEQGDIGYAETVLDDVLGSDVPAEAIGQRICWCSRAQLALAQDDPDRSLAVTDWLIATAPGSSDERRPIPRLATLRGQALSALGQMSAAETELKAARGRAIETEYYPLVWRIDMELGKLLQSQNRRDEAREFYASARTHIDQLATGIPDADLRDTFVRRAAERIPRAVGPASDRAVDLTPREVEVLRLIAEGQPDREIAEALYISPRTVMNHVGNILNKLGVNSRAAAAAIAIRDDLI